MAERKKRHPSKNRDQSVEIEQAIQIDNVKPNDLIIPSQENTSIPPPDQPDDDVSPDLTATSNIDKPQDEKENFEPAKNSFVERQNNEDDQLGKIENQEDINESSSIIVEKKDQLQKAFERISELEVEINRLSTRLSKVDAQLNIVRKKLTISIEEAEESKIKQSELQGINKALRSALEKEQNLRDVLAAKSENLNRQEQRLNNLKEELETFGENWNPEKVQELTVKNKSLERRVEKLEGDLGAADELLDEANRKIKELNRVEFSQLRTENDDLKNQVSLLEQKMREYEDDRKKIIQSKHLLERVAQLDKENPILYEENTRLKRENASLRSKIIVECSYRDLYLKIRNEFEELTKEIQLQNENEQKRLEISQRAYDSLRQLVEDTENNKVPNLTPWPGDKQAISIISSFVKKYNFEFEDSQIRAFLASIRSSRFIILKGFSGTGKSSLPQMIALSLGCPCVVVPVQPSWKSKVDLLGFYNHFEQRFLPSLFTKSLIRAMLPAFENRHFFILLDEMNLARVEYYFSDINSKLQNEKEPTIELFENIGNPTNLSIGKKILIQNNVISIPKNITFIGTINDDETTYAISDKIYDRAQVIDFQFEGHVHKKGEIPDQKSSPNTNSFSFDTFLTASRDHTLNTETLNKINEFLDLINDELRQRFAIMISYRSREQIMEFLRAYEFGGGKLDEGLDLQVVSKIIPKIKPRGNFEENLTQFENTILSLWPYESYEPKHTKSALNLLKTQV